MRLGVIDIGSNTVHLLVVDAHPGAQPLPAFSHKTELRLSENLKAARRVSDRTADRLVTFVRECLDVAEDQGVSDLFAFATSALRESPNGEAVIERVRTETGVELEALSGADEARMTFLAVRRWFGWSSGRLLVVDIGGGSLELAGGLDEEPDVALSLPLGAGRLTRERLPGDPPKQAAARELRSHVRAAFAEHVRPLLVPGPPDRAVGTSKTMRSLARIAGAAPRADGQFVPRTLSREDLHKSGELVGPLDAAARSHVTAVSEGTPRQLYAGALVAEAALDLLQLHQIQICPRAPRARLILRRLARLVP